jgi:hypothetical protein
VNITDGANEEEGDLKDSQWKSERMEE